MATPYQAVLWLSFGGPESPEELLPFLRNVTRGRNIPDDRLAVVADQYRLFGGTSPINDLNRELISSTATRLIARGHNVPIYFGNRNWTPFVEDTVREMLDDGINSAVVFATSGFGSYSSCRQYLDDIDRALASNAAEERLHLFKTPPFWDNPAFEDALVEVTSAAITRASTPTHQAIGVIGTMHSIPMSMSEGAHYRAQFAELRVRVGRRVSEVVGSDITVHEAYQSRSGPPTQPWLEPDVSERMAELADAGAETIVIVPFGFISDHQEVIYDLDTLASATADRLGVRFTRASTVSSTEAFREMIADIIAHHLDGGPGIEVPCAPSCCAIRVTEH